MYKGKEEQYKPEEISAHVLMKLKDCAERHVKSDGRTASSAVITVPAHFNQAQRQATCDAAKIANLKVKGIISEPTAAAIAYHTEFLKGKDEERYILIYDLGGGTFDVSLAHLQKNGDI